MAFGTLKGALTINAASITNPFTAVGSVAVVAGDLVFGVVCEQTNLTVTGVTDNLGNTYSAVNAGTDAGTITGRAFYSRVTVAGTLTGVNAAATASTDNAVFDAVVIEGPFVVSPLDAAPANVSDSASPFSCPATGVLAQASEYVLGWGSRTGTSSALWSATSPNVLLSEHFSSTVIACDIGGQVVSSTTSVAPEFTSATNPTLGLVGTASFKAATSAVLATTEASDTAAFGATTNTTASLAGVETADTAAFAATNASINQTAALAATEVADTAAFVVSTNTTATLAATENADTAAFAATVASTNQTAALAATEVADTASFSASVGTTIADNDPIAIAEFAIAEELPVATVVSAALAATESADTATAAATIQTNAVLAATESQDTAAFATSATATAALAATEDSDTAAFTTTIITTAAIAAVEAADTASFAATSSVTAALAATEDADTAAFQANSTAIAVTAVLAAIEDSDTAEFLATNVLPFTGGIYTVSGPGVSDAFPISGVSAVPNAGLGVQRRTA